MDPRLRLLVVSTFIVVVGFLTWLISNHATPGQALSLGVIVDGGTETMRTVDRLGKLATRLSIAEEIQLGHEISTKIESSFNSLRGGEEDAIFRSQQAYLSEVVSEIERKGGLRRPKIPYVAKLLDTSMENAFALPGGHVYITVGMLELLETEAELVAIMAHEIAHVDLKHCIERIQYDQAARKVGGRPARDLVAIGYGLFSVGFSDELEAEADRQGVIYAERVGYHPQAAQLVFSRLAAMEGSPGQRNTVGREVSGMIRDALQDYFNTHPPSSERIKRIEKIIKEQRFDLDWTPYYVGYENLEKLWPRSKKELESEFVTGKIYPPG